LCWKEAIISLLPQCGLSKSPSNGGSLTKLQSNLRESEQHLSSQLILTATHEMTDLAAWEAH